MSEIVDKPVKLNSKKDSKPESNKKKTKEEFGVYNAAAQNLSQSHATLLLKAKASISVVFEPNRSAIVKIINETQGVIGNIGDLKNFDKLSQIVNSIQRADIKLEKSEDSLISICRLLFKLEKKEISNPKLIGELKQEMAVCRAITNNVVAMTKAATKHSKIIPFIMDQASLALGVHIDIIKKKLNGESVAGFLKPALLEVGVAKYLYDKLRASEPLLSPGMDPTKILQPPNPLKGLVFSVDELNSTAILDNYDEYIDNDSKFEELFKYDNLRKSFLYLDETDPSDPDSLRIMNAKVFMPPFCLEPEILFAYQAKGKGTGLSTLIKPGTGNPADEIASVSAAICQVYYRDFPMINEFDRFEPFMSKEEFYEPGNKVQRCVTKYGHDMVDYTKDNFDLLVIKSLVGNRLIKESGAFGALWRTPYEAKLIASTELTEVKSVKKGKPPAEKPKGNENPPSEKLKEESPAEQTGNEAVAKLPAPLELVENPMRKSLTGNLQLPAMKVKKVDLSYLKFCQEWLLEKISPTELKQIEMIKESLPKAEIPNKKPKKVSINALTPLTKEAQKFLQNKNFENNPEIKSRFVNWLVSFSSGPIQAAAAKIAYANSAVLDGTDDNYVAEYDYIQDPLQENEECDME